MLGLQPTIYTSLLSITQHFAGSLLHPLLHWLFSLAPSWHWSCEFSPEMKGSIYFQNKNSVYLLFKAVLLGLWAESSGLREIQWLKIYFCVHFTYSILENFCFCKKNIFSQILPCFWVLKIMKIRPRVLWKILHGSTRSPSWL